MNSIKIKHNPEYNGVFTLNSIKKKIENYLAEEKSKIWNSKDSKYSKLINSPSKSVDIINSPVKISDSNISPTKLFSLNNSISNSINSSNII